MISLRDMKRLFARFFVIVLLSFLFVPSWCCTNFLAGRNATVDGSTLISYAADSYSLYGSLTITPARDHKKGSVRKIFDWDTGKYLGEIPEVAHTYRVVGNMNEHQVTIGETTFTGREELQDTTGVIDYGSLIYIALERSRTAREAINVMTSLVQEYGYYSTGESFSVGDPREVWILELIGKGPDEKGAVWAAVRIPDDCVAGHANQARIRHIDFNASKDRWMWSEDVVEFARRKGYYSGDDADFSFADAYCPLDFSGLFVCETRVWSIFRKVNAAVDRYLPYVLGNGGETLPLWVKPDRKVSAQDFKEFMRDQFEGTPLDITQGVGAGPHHSKVRETPLSFTVNGQKYWYARPVATQQTGWCFVAQMRPGAPQQTGGVFWFGVDDASASVMVPFFSCSTIVPECFSGKNGSLSEYSPTSAFWTFNRVANMAYFMRYDSIMGDIRKHQKLWDEKFNRWVVDSDNTAEAVSAGRAQKYLSKESAQMAEELTRYWDRLGNFLLVKYVDGAVKKETNGVFYTTPEGMVDSIRRPGFGEHWLPLIAPTELGKEK